MKKLILLIALTSCLTLLSQQVQRTQIFNRNIKTLQIGKPGEKLGLPIIEFNSSDIIEVNFDEMSHEAHSYSYKVMHCNADWTLSNLSSTEYLSGFTTANISDYTLSVNTTYLYTHYKFDLPNNDMSFKISGNYVISIYEDNQTDKPIALACFSLVDPKIGITSNIRGNTDVELNGRYQQLDFDVNLKGYSVRDPNTEFKVVVRQNNRIDNEVTNIKPTYLNASKLSYVNNKSLIFDGGYEYHRFDISSVYAAGEGVESIRYTRPYYDAFLTESKIQTSRIYMHDLDVNGKFVINLQNSDDDNVEADYMMVHFTLAAKSPYFDGQLYLGGEFNFNLLDDVSHMKHDVNKGIYYNSVLLKQGGYNYQYWFLPKGATKATAERVEGSYWQTKNEYTIYVYHRPWGERYDKLVGVKVLE
ncbi:MAG: DUF5103 domain-containing protein [Paludibacter sp.]|nr:DUF5103 domain-containing protein [Paludibacter sp.]